MKFVDLIKKHSDVITYSPIARENIVKAEKELNVTFSKEYVEYVAEFGIAIFEGHEFTGLCDGKRLDVVRITKEQRNIHKFVSRNLYVVECTDIDDIVIWQDSDGIVYASIPNSNPQKIADSIMEYVLK